MPVSGLPTPLRGGNGRKVAVVKPFTDQRAQPNRCGMQKNGYNVDTANAVCRTPPAEWIAQLLADELRASGFTVVEPTAATPGTLVIDGTLLQLFVEPMAEAFSARAEADIQVRLEATSQSGLRASRTFFAKGVWRGFAGVTTPFQDSLKKASDQILEEMVGAILELMNRYPQLGAGWASPEGARCTS
jgi:hypothetical protein